METGHSRTDQELYELHRRRVQEAYSALGDRAASLLGNRGLELMSWQEFKSRLGTMNKVQREKLESQLDANIPTCSPDECLRIFAQIHDGPAPTDATSRFREYSVRASSHPSAGSTR